jgi:1-acylglycerone phosphate reductase
MPSQKTVLITGCSAGSLGSFFAREFKRREYHVIATARSITRLTELRDFGIETLELDVSSSDSIAKLRSQITHLDVLFNNAGVTKAAMFTDTSMEDFRTIFNVNVLGTFELIQAFIPLLIESKGTIVNHTSQAAHFMSICIGAYGASKAALSSISNTLRVELAPFDISVVELVAGAAPSNMTSFNPNAALPQDSLYLPIQAEINPLLCGKTFESYRKNGTMPDGDVYAKQVIGELLDTKKKWIWAGYMATLFYWLWFIEKHWKGSMDWLLLSQSKVGLLKGRLSEVKKSK